MEFYRVPFSHAHTVESYVAPFYMLSISRLGVDSFSKNVPPIGPHLTVPEIKAMIYFFVMSHDTSCFFLPSAVALGFFGQHVVAGSPLVIIFYSSFFHTHSGYSIQYRLHIVPPLPLNLMKRQIKTDICQRLNWHQILDTDLMLQRGARYMHAAGALYKR